MNGIINILKPAGMTSHDVVSAVRRILNEKKAGHTGTLDPMAVGVLPVCLGSATRITEYLDADYKKYRCEMQLGIRTETEDIWGTVISRDKVTILHDKSDRGCESPGTGMIIFAEDLKKAASSMEGDILQTPPNYSAVRVGGRRLYEYARSGETVTVEPRKINVKKLSVIDIDYDDARIRFDVESSKGSYIRTICSEIGEILGCGAAMSFLVRTAAGRFDVADSVTLEELEKAYAAGTMESILKPADYPLSRFNGYEVKDKARAKCFINGGPLSPDEVEGNAASESGVFKIYFNGEFLAIARYNSEAGRIISDKVFCRDLQS